MNRKLTLLVRSLSALIVNASVLSAAYVTTPSLDTITVDLQAEHLLTYGSAASSGGVTLQVDTMGSGASRASTISNAQQAGEWSWGYDDGAGSMVIQMKLDSNENLFVGGNRVLTTADGVLTGSSIASGTGANALVFGATGANSATSAYAYAFGQGTDATGLYSFANGLRSEASGVRSIAFGVDTKAVGNDSFVSGVRSIATDHYSQAHGFESSARATHARAYGQKSLASGIYSFASGVEAKAQNDFSFAFGRSIRANGLYSLGFGQHNDIWGNYGINFGNRNIVSGDFGLSSGHELRVSSFHATVFGRYNVTFGQPDIWKWDDLLFAIGNGVDANSRSNALHIRKNGQMTVKNRFWDAADREAVPTDPDPATPEDESTRGIGLVVLGHTNLHGNTSALGRVWMGSDATVIGKMSVVGNAHIGSDALVSGDTTVVGKLRVHQVSGNIPMYQP